MSGSQTSSSAVHIFKESFHPKPFNPSLNMLWSPILPRIWFWLGFLTILRVGLQAITRLPKLCLFCKPSGLQASPSVRFSFSLFSHLHYFFEFLLLTQCFSSLLFPSVFPICFHLPILLCIPTPYIASP